jgi:hypothetical protein
MPTHVGENQEKEKSTARFPQTPSATPSASYSNTCHNNKWQCERRNARTRGKTSESIKGRNWRNSRHCAALKSSRQEGYAVFETKFSLNTPLRGRIRINGHGSGNWLEGIMGDAKGEPMPFAS